MSEIKRRITKIEKKIPKPKKEYPWLQVIYPITASEPEKGAARNEAIKRYEDEHGRELNREQINWIEIEIVETREQAERFGLVDKPNYPKRSQERA